MIKLGVFFGGCSGEHEVSLVSGPAVMRAADKEKYEIVPIGITRKGKWLLYEGPLENIENGSWEKEAQPFDIAKIKEKIDFAFPVIHGTNGEDGTIQGLFEMLDVPYAGCGVLSSAINMDKGFTKDIFVKYGIPTAKYELVTSKDLEEDLDATAHRIEKALGYPVFVKPANAGSSVGITKAKDFDGLKEALLEANKFDRRIVAEEAINAREIETGVIGNEVPEVASVGEIVVSADFYDYKAKYTDDAGTVLDIPARITKEQMEEVKSLAVKAYKALDCAGFSRVDFFLERNTGKIMINELNTIPGFTKYSMFPSLWKEEGVSFSQLIDKIIGYGYERYNAKNNR